jgi:phage shock protein PspC (stress-responsive transcriptional regulator)
MSMQNKTLYRSRSNRMIAGVCGGLGQFFGVDPTLIRLIFVLGTIFGLGSLIIVYIVLYFVVPEEPAGYSPTPPVSAPSVPAEPVQTIDVEPETTDTESV